MQQSVCKLAFSVYANIVFHKIHIFSNDRHAFYVEGIIEFYKCVAYAINMGDLTQESESTATTPVSHLNPKQFHNNCNAASYAMDSEFLLYPLTVNKQ